MADNLGNITFSQVNFYAKGVWTDKYYNLKSVYAGLSSEGEYHFVDKIILPSFTKQTYPFTLSITASILKGASNSSKAGTAKMWLYDYDPTGAAWASTPATPPSNYIGYGEGSYSGLTQSHQYFDFTVTISNTNLVSGGTYYLWVDTTTHTTWQYDKQISGTLNGTDVKTLTLIKGTGISEFTGAGDYAINSKAATTVTTSTGYHLTKYSGTNYNGVGTGEWAVSGTSDSTEWTMGADRTITAHAAIDTYTVSYNANGGSGAPAAQTKTYGVNLTLSSTRPTKANAAATGYKVTFNPNGGTCATADLTAARTTSYTFTSWNTAANGTGTTYNAGATYSANANLALYAQYSSSIATSAITLPTATRTGYTFKGWSTSSNATSGITGQYTPGGATTLYAIWQINTYTLTLDSSGTGIASFTGGGTFNYGSLAETTATASTGYHLTKYTGTQYDGTSGGEWAIAGNVTTDTDNWTMNTDRTIKVWASPNTYTVTYNGNGATSGSMSNSTATYNAGFRTKQNAFVRPGYKMSGWNEKADGSGTWWYLDRPGTYESGQDWNWNYTKNITLYAQWEPNGTVRIWNGSKWVLALPFIYTGATKGWIQAIPYTYVNNTDQWKLCGG